MSVLFVVGSEEEFSCGATWCAALADVAGSNVHVVVLGSDRKTLAEYAKRRVAEQLGLTSDDVAVELVEHAVEAVLAYAKSSVCDTLLMVYRTSEKEFQRSLFEASMIRTFWVAARDRGDKSPSDPAPESINVYSMFRRPNMLTSVVSEQMLGITPSETLCANVDIENDDLSAAVTSAMQAKQVRSGDLVLCGVDEAIASDRIYRAGLVLLEEPPDATIALVHTGHSLAETVAATVHGWAAAVAPPMEREERIELAADLQTGSQLNLEFLGLISASAMLAAFGLLQDSAAVIIGAMLIAPLMTPIVGAGLALAQGNRPLFQSAIWTVFLGFVSALTASTLFGWLVLLFQEPNMTGEMLARSRPSPLDFCVGLVGGIAASYARTRKHLSSALAGAAIAAALVPPISTAGLQIAFRVWAWDEPADGVPVLGPLLLVSANVLTIMIGSSFVLWARGMRNDRKYAVKDRWTLRTFALLMTLALLTLIWILYPFQRT